MCAVRLRVFLFSFVVLFSFSGDDFRLHYITIAVRRVFCEGSRYGTNDKPSVAYVVSRTMAQRKYKICIGEKVCIFFFSSSSQAHYYTYSMPCIFHTIIVIYLITCVRVIDFVSISSVALTCQPA